MDTNYKELLTRDLCARLPYGFTIHRYSDNANIKINDIDEFAHFLEYSDGEEFKPYLRPISSMTEDERKDWFKYSCVDYDCEFKPEPTLYVGYCHLSVDWLNAHHFDYRGLIEKGLALEAPEGMYN